MIEVMFNASLEGTIREVRRDVGIGSDIIDLDLELHIGDIQKPVTGEYRSKLLYNLYYQKQWGIDLKMKSELKKLGNTYSKELKRLREYLDSGEAIRVWYDSAPHSLCGLMWLCSELGDSQSTISTIRLPNITVNGDTAITYTSWVEVDPNRLGLFLDWERVLSAAEIRAYAQRWNRLKLENAPLRAVVNGSVISVPSNFYDFLIFKYLGDRPIREAQLIGTILGENPLGICDWWYARRIDKLIDQKRIKIIENSPRKYERLIAKNDL